MSNMISHKTNSMILLLIRVLKTNIWTLELNGGNQEVEQREVDWGTVGQNVQNFH